jgi:hypothetical protein
MGPAGSAAGGGGGKPPAGKGRKAAEQKVGSCARA